MDQLLTGKQHISPNEAGEEIVRRTCRFWHSERQLLRPLFGLAAVDHEVAAILAQREHRRGNQMQRLIQRLTTETATASSFDQPDILAAVIAVTSFPAYDALAA